MKTNKIIGVSIATLGVAFSIGGAVALYTKPVGPVGFGIGAATYTSNTSIVTYKINNAAGTNNVAPTFYKDDDITPGEDQTGFSEVNRSVKYEFTFSADYADGLTVQDYVVGNLSVSLTGVAAGVQGNIETSMYFLGYSDSTLGKVLYGSNLTSSSTPINNTTVSGASLTVDSRDICVATSGVQKLVVFIKLDDSLDTLTMNELNNLWTLSVTWAQPSNTFDAAYMANPKVEWAEDDEFVMAPNINKAYSSESDFEWWAQIKGASDLALAKCRQNDVWENSNNHDLTLNQVYNVRWSGRAADAAVFTNRA